MSVHRRSQRQRATLCASLGRARFTGVRTAVNRPSRHGKFGTKQNKQVAAIETYVWAAGRRPMGLIERLRWISGNHLHGRTFVHDVILDDAPFYSLFPSIARRLSFVVSVCSRHLESALPSLSRLDRPFYSSVITLASRPENFFSAHVPRKRLLISPSSSRFEQFQPRVALGQSARRQGNRSHPSTTTSS